MCERCVKSGKMTQEEMETQRAEMADILGMVSENGLSGTIVQMMVAQMADEFVSMLAQSGYELSVGLLANGNVAIGLIKSSENETGLLAGGGYVMAEFSADGIRKMLETGDK